MIDPALIAAAVLSVSTVAASYAAWGWRGSQLRWKRLANSRLDRIDQARTEALRREARIAHLEAELDRVPPISPIAVDTKPSWARPRARNGQFLKQDTMQTG